MLKERVLVLLSIAITFSVAAQTDRYFVTFKDKNNSAFSISAPLQFLSQKSIDRRKKQNIAVTMDDLPVNSGYVTQIKSTGAKIFFTSKWWNGLLIQTDNATLQIIKALPFVLKTELVAPGSKLLGGRQPQMDREEQAVSSTNESQLQLQQLSLDKMQEEGYHGEGVNIAQFDSGWIGVNVASPFAHLFQEGRIKDVFNFVNNSTNVYTDDNHGTEVLSVMGAYIAGVFTGGAYKANFYLFQTEDKVTEYRIEEYNWAFAAERADSIGVDVINSSLGYNVFDDPSMNYSYANMNGKTTVISITARMAVERGMMVVCSAGNEGNKSWKFVTAPADVEGVLAVGSISSLGTISAFSSVGPTNDGRLKPDVVALGSGTTVIKSDGNIGTASGTSLSSPLVACLAAGLVQAFPTLAPKQLYNSIKNSGNQAGNPNNLLGYGIPSFTIAKEYIKAMKDDLDIFPNPTSKFLSISFKEPTNKIVTISLSNLFGQKISDKTITLTWDNNPLQYDCSSLPNGIYLLEVIGEWGSTVRKIVKTD